MAESVDVVVVGAGQAGLSLSHELTRASIEHLVLERSEVGESWRRRWDSFCLVVPNWSVRLPGGAYDGDDPDGFMPKAEIVDFLKAYATGFNAPVRSGVEVSAVTQREEDGAGGFLLQTSTGDIHARDVVLAAGGYQKAHRPAAAAQLAEESVLVIDAEDYLNPSALPPGEVLVVGSGQTGCQLADECFRAGRTVHLACGRAPWIPRRFEGRDSVSWLLDTKFFEARLEDLPPATRLGANPQLTGAGGGRDLNYRVLQALGVNLLGHFAGAEAGRAHFAGDLHDLVAFGDARYAFLCDLIAKSCASRSMPAPEMPEPPPFQADPPESLDLGSVGAVIFTTGFRPDYNKWVSPAEAFDESGFPIQVDGSSTVVPGLHFMGLHFQRKRKSATLFGVAEDAGVLGERIAAR